MTAKKQLIDLIAEADELIGERVTTDDKRFQSWHRRCRLFITKNYTDVELKSFNCIIYLPFLITGGNTEDEYIDSCCNGIMSVKEKLEGFLMDQGTKRRSDKVFIVHGHDGELKYEIARIIDKLGLESVILHEQQNSGSTIIEKLEANISECSAAIILFTPDDLGNTKGDTVQLKRARQNVVFEAGYTIGCLGRSNTMIIVTDKDMELPGDLSGIVYTGKDSLSLNIVKELKSMGFNVCAEDLPGFK